MKYRLQDLIDIELFQNLQDRLNKIYSFPSSIIDNDGNILTATAWQDACTQFHRKNKDSERHCIKSDQYILDHLHEANPAVSYRCPHGLVDNATPIIIDGIHYGNFFTGQFFLEEPDMDFFTAQAEKYGFDKDAYLEAIKKVPVWTQEQLNNYLFFIKGLITVISESGLKKLKEIENRKKIEESMKRNHSILKTAMDGFWLTDTEGRLLEVNDAYCNFSGYSEGELLTMRIADLEADESPELVDIHMKKVIAKGSDRFESRHRRKDGTVFDIEVSTQFRAEEGGQCVCFLRDVTERKKAEEEKEKLKAQLLQSRKMESIGTLAGGIAHDFNNILSPLMIHAEMAMMDLPPGSTVRNNLQQIYKAGERARDLVKQILTFARKSEGGRVRIKASLIIKEAVKFLRSTIPATVDIRHDFSAEHDAVFADPTQLNRIIMNLCTNAAHAMGEKGGLIEVLLKNEDLYDDKGTLISDLESGRYVKLTVKDNGQGIEPQLLDKIFDPYFTTKDVGKGTGMGLALVHGIVKSYGGAVTVQSEAGKGTAFHVYLPLVEWEGDLPETALDTKHFPTGSERILFVDDEQAAVVTLQFMLERLGYRVTARSSSLEALEAFRRHPRDFDLVITDQTMPDMTGKELAVELMSIRPDIPVILCTGFSEHIDEKRAKAMGIRAFVMKPIIVSRIANTIREILDKTGSAQ